MRYQVFLVAIGTVLSTPLYAQSGQGISVYCRFYSSTLHANGAPDKTIFSPVFNVTADFARQYYNKSEVTDAEVDQAGRSAIIAFAKTQNHDWGFDCESGAQEPVQRSHSAAIETKKSRRADSWNAVAVYDMRFLPMPKLEQRDEKQSDKRSLTLSFRSAAGQTGYLRAEFKLNYKALLCAGEVQIAYSVDRKSLNLGGRTYNIRWGNQTHEVAPLRDAPMPVAVPILLTVWDGLGRNNIGRIDDKIAGESLGMGCFTGQTKSIGKASVLIGANATPEAIRKYLAAITLIPLGQDVGVVLRHPDIVVPPYKKDQEFKGPQFRELKVAGTTQGGEAVSEAVVAPEPSRPLYDPAETARNQARVAKLLAEADARRRDAAAYPAKMEAFREAQAARQRKIAEDQAAYDARMAEWRRKVAACNAGDRASCVP